MTFAEFEIAEQAAYDEHLGRVRAADKAFDVSALEAQQSYADAMAAHETSHRKAVKGSHAEYHRAERAAWLEFRRAQAGGGK